MIGAQNPAGHWDGQPDGELADGGLADSGLAFDNASLATSQR